MLSHICKLTTKKTWFGFQVMTFIVQKTFRMRLPEKLDNFTETTQECIMTPWRLTFLQDNDQECSFPIPKLARK